MKTSYIYIITDGQDYKVGVSSNPERRLKTLQTGSPKKLKLVKVFEVESKDVFRMEKEAHRKIQAWYVKRGEWFTGATEFHIDLLVDEIHQKYSKN